MLMALLEKEQFHIYWINLLRNIMGSKDFLFLNPASNHVCVRFLLILKDHREGMAAICGRYMRGKDYSQPVCYLLSSGGLIISSSTVWLCCKVLGFLVFKKSFKFQSSVWDANSHRQRQAEVVCNLEQIESSCLASNRFMLFFKGLLKAKVRGQCGPYTDNVRRWLLHETEIL